jgi:8-oxo-dGTP diphosphatase
MREMREKIGNDLLMMIGASGVVVNAAGEVLLHRRSDNGRWSLPGGAVDPDEQPADAVVREVFEETGVQVIPVRLIGVYSGAELFFTYADGNQVAITSVAFLCQPVGGEPRINDDESLEVRYFAPDALPDSLLLNHVLRIQHALGDDQAAFFRGGKVNEGTPRAGG